MVEYEDTISGFKVTGSWEEIVEHGERVGFALKQIDLSEYDVQSEYEEYNDWRPKVHERMDSDVSEKTAEKASMSESDIEQTHSEEYNRNNDTDQSITQIFDVLEILLRKSVRESEEAVYKHLMTKISPQYFDNQLISANLDRIDTEDGLYTFEININNDNLKNDVRQKLEQHTDEYSRWHLKTQYETDGVENTEGVELPDSNSNPEDVDPKKR